MNDFNEYVVAEFDFGIRLCKAPFTSMVKKGDLITEKTYKQIISGLREG